jgi:hypothetical protein
VSVDKFRQEPEDTETAATIERRAFVVEDPIPVRRDSYSGVPSVVTSDDL